MSTTLSAADRQALDNDVRRRGIGMIRARLRKAVRDNQPLTGNVHPTCVRAMAHALARAEAALKHIEGRAP